MESNGIVFDDNFSMKWIGNWYRNKTDDIEMNVGV